MAELTIDALLDGLTEIVSAASAAILAIPRSDLDTQLKSDASPVTAADTASEAVILHGLARLMPDVQVISEESISLRAPGPASPRFLLVDPLDGTREFVAGRDEYAVNIGLVENGIPTVGVIAAPARGLIWRGAVDHGATRVSVGGNDTVPVHTKPRPASGARVLVSRSHLDPATEAYVDRLPHPEKISCGSSLKFCLLAEGGADLYPRFGPTSEWDIAAGHALLRAAGGEVSKPDGSPLLYGEQHAQGSYRVAGFIATGDRRPL